MKDVHDLYADSLTELARVQATHDNLQAQLKQARAENRQLRLFLDLAVRYLGRAVADDLMSNCVVHPRDALRRIEAGVRELDKKK